MNPVGHEPGGDDREEVRAVNSQVGRAVEVFAARVQRRTLQGAAVLPAPLMRAHRAHRLAVECRAKAKTVEGARRVGPHVDAAADLRELGRLLVDVDVEAGPPERDRGGEPPEAGADDGDAERRDPRHDARPYIHISTAVHNVKM
jgi:hypothetical protein